MTFFSSEPSLASISLGARGTNKWGGKRGVFRERTIAHTVPYHLSPVPSLSNPAPHSLSTQAARPPCTFLNMLIGTILPHSLCLAYCSFPGTFFPRNCTSPLLQLFSNITFPVRLFLFILKIVVPFPQCLLFSFSIFSLHSTYQLPEYYTTH